MARPRKTGIDYFSVDVDMLNDRKTRRVMRSCGAESIAVIMQLLCLAYSETGYYLAFDDDITFDVADALKLDDEYINNVILACVEAEFFDKTMFEKHDILTSRRMQKNYVKASEKRVSNDINPLYDLVSADETPVSAEETEVSGEETLVSGVDNPQSIVKHSIGKDSIVKNSIEEAANNSKEGNSAREDISQDEVNRLKRTFGEVTDDMLCEYADLKERYGGIAVVDALVTTRLRGGKMLGYTATILSEDYATRA